MLINSSSAWSIPKEHFKKTSRGIIIFSDPLLFPNALLLKSPSDWHVPILKTVLMYKMSINHTSLNREWLRDNKKQESTFIKYVLWFENIKYCTCFRTRGRIINLYSALRFEKIRYSCLMLFILASILNALDQLNFVHVFALHVDYRYVYFELIKTSQPLKQLKPSYCNHNQILFEFLIFSYLERAASAHQITKFLKTRSNEND